MGQGVSFPCSLSRSTQSGMRSKLRIKTRRTKIRVGSKFKSKMTSTRLTSSPGPRHQIPDSQPCGRGNAQSREQLGKSAAIRLSCSRMAGRNAGSAPRSSSRAFGPISTGVVTSRVPRKGIRVECRIDSTWLGPEHRRSPSRKGSKNTNAVLRPG